MNILMVLTSHDSMGDTGHKTGFWLEEFAAPYYVLKDAGATLTLASPKGGQPPVDPNSTQPDALTDATERFDKDDVAKAELANTQKLESVSAADFDAVFYPGGHGPLWDLTHNADSLRLISEFSSAGKLVAAVCHAPAVLLEATDGNDNPLIAGRRVTGFANTEEEAVGLSEVVPFLLEDALKQKGAQYVRSDNDFAPYCIHDGLLITGQNPASSADTAKILLEALR